MSNPPSSRRQFLEGAVAGGAVAALAQPAAASQAASQPQAQRNVGVVGIGGRGSGHVKLLQKLAPSVTVAAVCDVVPERAERGRSLAGGGATPYTDFAKMLEHRGLDTVMITTPNYVHKGQVVAALDGGFFTFVEKPMACTIEDCNAIIDAARRNRRNRNKGICQVGLQMRYSPLYRRIHEMVGEGAIGEIKFVWAENFRGDWRRLFDDPDEERRKNWRYFQRLSGGSIVEKNCHDLDVFGWIIGARALRVAGTGGVNVYTGRETLDHYSITVDYENGCKLTLGTCLYAPGRHETVVVGSKGMLEFPRGGDHLILRRKRKKDERISVLPEHDVRTNHTGTHEMHVDFFRCTREGRMPFCNPAAAKACIRVAVAGEIAVGQQRSVRLDELPA